METGEERKSQKRAESMITLIPKGKHKKQTFDIDWDI